MGDNTSTSDGERWPDPTTSGLIFPVSRNVERLVFYGLSIGLAVVGLYLMGWLP